MFQDALPVWAEVGVDRAFGGFVEKLDEAGRPDFARVKRVRGQARQIYVFSHAATLGFGEGAEIAARGWDFVRRHAALEGGGWARTLARDGAVADPTLDLYEQACMLLALAWLHRATGEAEPIRAAEEGFEAVRRRLGRLDGQGFRACDPGDEAGLQNPHMHLLEAMLALHAATGAARWADEARGLVRLFGERLYDPATGTLGERFEAGWRRGEAMAVEPGHHYEWVWLLGAADRALGTGHGDEANGLFAFAEAHGRNPATGLAWDEVATDGTVLTPTHRLWPQTERLKALVARDDQAGNIDQPGMTAAVDALFGGFIAAAPRGGWRDRLDARGQAIDASMPASGLYHLFVAFAALWARRPS